MSSFTEQIAKQTNKLPKNNKPTQRPNHNGKRLTPVEKYAILAEKNAGKSALQVSKEYGVHHSTIAYIWNDKKLQALKEQVSTVKSAMVDNLYLTADASMNQIHTNLHKASAKDAAITMSICIDKARLLSNESTQNHAINGYMSICNQVKD